MTRCRCNRSLQEFGISGRVSSHFAALWAAFLAVDNSGWRNTLHPLTKEECRLLKRRHIPKSPEGCEHVLTEIKLKKGESVEKALRRLKKKIDREGTLRVVRSHRHFEKPSEKRRRKEKAARFSAMLSARYADM